MYFTLWCCRESKSSGREGWGYRGRESLFCTKPNPHWNDSTVPYHPEPAGLWAREWGQQVGLMAPRDTQLPRLKSAGVSWTLTELRAHGARLSPTAAGWWLSPTPRAAGTHPQGHGIFFSPGIPRWLWDRNPPQTQNQSFYCTKSPPTVLAVLGSRARSSVGTLGCSISVCSLPPLKNNEKRLGMLQARSLCFRLFSTKRLGNKAHSFPSRESERGNCRKQNLKT